MTEHRYVTPCKRRLIRSPGRQIGSDRPPWGQAIADGREMINSLVTFVFAAAVIIPFVAMPFILRVGMILFSSPHFAAMLIVRHERVPVPVVSYEIDRPAAGVVFTAVLRPMLLVSHGHAQVQRGTGVMGVAFNDYRCWIDHLWRLRNVANVDLTVVARLANADRDADIGSMG